MFGIQNIKLIVSNLYRRHYSKKVRQMTSIGKFMVHQETLRYVNLYANVKVQTDIGLCVTPVDVEKYTSGDVLIAQLYGDEIKNCTAILKVDVSDDEQQVNVVVKKLTDKTHFYCDLKIPIRSDLFIEALDDVRVQCVEGKTLNINTNKDISTKDVRVKQIALKSKNGNIKCTGTILGKCIKIETMDGNITIDKLKGGDITCQTNAGNIKTGSCYAEKSKFQTDSGNLNLQNVHKQTEVLVTNCGQLNMTGVHGNLQVKTQGGSMNMQLSELIGENLIQTNNLDDAVINISKEIQEKVHIEASANHIMLDSSLNAIKNSLSHDKTKLKLSNVAQGNRSKLLIYCNGGKGLHLGKLSWADMICTSMVIKK